MTTSVADVMCRPFVYARSTDQPAASELGAGSSARLIGAAVTVFAAHSDAYSISVYYALDSVTAGG
eukprot:1096283-Prymnesium_polylepis.1